MDINEEKKIIYELMRELIAERRELSSQYYDLKYRLMELESTEKNKKNLVTEKTLEKDVFDENKKNSRSESKRVFIPFTKPKKVPFERIATYVVETLKNSDIPLSNKSIHEALNDKYGLQIQYSNLTNNILPRISQSNSYPIEKIHRGFWQYRKHEEK